MLANLRGNPTFVGCQAQARPRAARRRSRFSPSRSRSSWARAAGPGTRPGPSRTRRPTRRRDARAPRLRIARTARPAAVTATVRAGSASTASAATPPARRLAGPARAGVAGNLRLVAAGAQPRDRQTCCPAADASTCGLTAPATAPAPAASTSRERSARPALRGAAVVGVNVCDGLGRCKAGPPTICAPFYCDPTTGACLVTCRSNADCVRGIACVNGSCGPKPRGAVCSKDGDCASGFCADGVCCNVACRGGCVSLRQTGPHRAPAGPSTSAAPIRAALPRPGCRELRQTGTCDGFGGCAIYARRDDLHGADVHGRPPQNGRHLRRHRHLPRAGVQICAPFRCSERGLHARCSCDADCISPHVCVNGQCGTKQRPTLRRLQRVRQQLLRRRRLLRRGLRGRLPQLRPAVVEGPVRVRSRRAPPIRAAICADQGQAKCGTDGLCDGASGCRKYQPGTVCAPERCDDNVYTPPATCSETGTCVAPDAQPCAPFACNGARCFVACTTDANCVARKSLQRQLVRPEAERRVLRRPARVRVGHSAPRGSAATGCASACKSCALPTSMGACTNVPDGQPIPPAPAWTAAPPAAGTTASARRARARATRRERPAGPHLSGEHDDVDAGGHLRRGRELLDAGRHLVLPVQLRRRRLQVDVHGGRRLRGARRLQRTARAGSSPTARSAATATNARAASAPRASAATPTVRAAACRARSRARRDLPAVAAGAPVPPASAAIRGRRPARPTASATARRLPLYGAGTQCAPPSCPVGADAARWRARATARARASRRRPSRARPTTATGRPAARPAPATPTACAGTVCNSGSCGKKRLGQLCAAGTECASGNCVDGVCCSSASCRPARRAT